jgi:hypothetical protein
MQGSQKLDKTFYEVTRTRLPQTSMLRLFDILVDEVDRYTKFMNIFKSLRINTTAQQNLLYFQTYDVEDETFWDNISFELYGTPYLWWTITLFNDVVNPYEELEGGTSIKVLKPDHIYTLFKDMEAVAEL